MTTTKAQIRGDWKGKLDIQWTILKLVFHIEEKEGDFSGTFASPTQGVSDVPLTQVSFESNTLRFSLANAAFSYLGEFAADTIKGFLKQEGESYL